MHFFAFSVQCYVKSLQVLYFFGRIVRIKLLYKNKNTNNANAKILCKKVYVNYKFSRVYSFSFKCILCNLLYCKLIKVCIQCGIL